MREAVRLAINNDIHVSHSSGTLCKTQTFQVQETTLLSVQFMLIQSPVNIGCDAMKAYLNLFRASYRMSIGRTSLQKCCKRTVYLDS